MKKRCFLIGILLLVSAVGCLQPIVIDPPENRDVVVKCILMNGVVPKVELFYTGSIGDMSHAPVENAKVMISTRDGAVKYFNYVEGGSYVCNFTPVPQKDYTLTVIVPGKDTISAHTTIPAVFEMESCFIPPEQWLDDSERVFTEAGWKEYDRIYPWALQKYGVEAMREANGSSLLDKMPGMLYRVTTSWPPVLYVVGTNESSGETTHAVELATNHLGVDKSNMNEKVYQPENYVSSSNTLQQQFEQAVLARYDGLPLYNDYLRIVSGYEYDNGLGELYRIVFRGQVEPDELLWDASPYFAVIGDITYNYWGDGGTRRRSSLYFCSVSEEYDQYLQDCYRQIRANEADVLSALYSNASNIYTNIKGGMGIFGAMYVLRHDCDLVKEPALTLPRFYRSDYYCEYPPYPAPLPEL